MITKTPKAEKAKAPKKAPNKKAKSATREWLDALLFAVVMATLIRWFVFTPYTIPTGSMERSLLIGDFIYVSKLHYGVTTPKTPLQLPLTHQKIWGTEMASYLDWIQLPQFRLPGFSDVERGDVVVFNYPGELEHPLDMRNNYIKRAVAIHGDTLSIKDAQVMVNGKAVDNPAEMQLKYYAEFKQPITIDFLKRYNITEGNYGSYNEGLLMLISPQTADKIAALPITKTIRPLNEPEGKNDSGLMLEKTKATLNWNLDNFGPLVVPAEGMTVALTEENIAKYYRTIKYYEGYKPEDVALVDGKVSIEGQPADSYTFKQDYYFMMGDNRNNSLDSRFWGFVPHDHVVGKPLFVWMSIDPNEGFLDKIRWNRLFKRIE